MGILCTPNCALSSLPTDAPNAPTAEAGTPWAQGSVQGLRDAWPGAGAGIPVIPTESSPSGLELGRAEGQVAELPGWSRRVTPTTTLALGSAAPAGRSPSQQGVAHQVMPVSFCGVHRRRSVPVTMTEVPIRGGPLQTAKRLGEVAAIMDGGEMT